ARVCILLEETSAGIGQRGEGRVGVRDLRDVSVVIQRERGRLVEGADDVRRMVRPRPVEGRCIAVGVSYRMEAVLIVGEIVNRPARVGVERLLVPAVAVETVELVTVLG